MTEQTDRSIQLGFAPRMHAVENSAVAPIGADTYSSAMSDARNYIEWILGAFSQYLRPPILEVGVGHGSYTSILRTYGAYSGIDIDPEAIASAKSRFPDLMFSTADITEDSFAHTVSPGQFGAIVCLNVLEHIEDDSRAIINLAKTLEIGGHLLLIVPALPILYNDLDRLAGHRRRYFRADVSKLLNAAGLDNIRCDYFNPLGAMGWFANKLVKHRSLDDSAVNAQITLFDRWLVPVSRVVDPVSRSFFGQSVIAIGRRT